MFLTFPVSEQRHLLSLFQSHPRLEDSQAKERKTTPAVTEQPQALLQKGFRHQGTFSSVLDTLFFFQVNPKWECRVFHAEISSAKQESTRARTEETLGESLPFVPFPLVLRTCSQINPCHLAGHSRKTNPPRFRGRLHFREKTPVTWPEDPLRDEQRGLGAHRALSRPGRGMDPHPVYVPWTGMDGSTSSLCPMDRDGWIHTHLGRSCLSCCCWGTHSLNNIIRTPLVCPKETE